MIILHWINTLVLKIDENTYRPSATSPFPLRGNTNARFQGHGGILCIFAKEVPKGVAVAEGFLVPLLRSIKTRIVSRQHACFWRRWKVFCCSSTVLLKTAPVRVSFIQITQVRVQNKGKSVWKSRYIGDVSTRHCFPPPSVIAHKPRHNVTHGGNKRSM